MVRAVAAAIMVCCFMLPDAVRAASLPTFDSLSPISVPNGDGTRDLAHVAVSVDGRLYVAENGRDAVAVFTAEGSSLGTWRGIKKPQAIAINSKGNVYVSSLGDMSVIKLSPQGARLGMLGVGDKEFIWPNFITVDQQNDEVYVVDQGAHAIKVYSEAGSLLRTIPDTGNFPLAAAIHGNELYVLDRPFAVLASGNSVQTVKIRVFDKTTGNVVGSFGEYGNEIGKMFQPKSIASDASGRLFVVDAFHRVVYCYDGPNRGYLGAIYNSVSNALVSPQGVAVSKSGKLFVSDRFENNLSVFGLDNFTVLSVTPDSFSFTVTNGVSNPASGTLSLANSGKGILSYSISSATEDGAAWIQLSGTSGTVSAVNGTAEQTVSIYGSGLAAGAYTGTITVQDIDNTTVPSAVRAEKKVPVTLTVSNPALQISATAFAFEAAHGSAAPMSRDMTVTLSGDAMGSIAWRATAATNGSGNWISVSPSANTGNSVTTVTITADPTGLAAGTYEGTITFTAPGASGAPAALQVTLIVKANSIVSAPAPKNIVVSVVGSRKTGSKIQIFDRSLALAQEITPFGSKYIDDITVAAGDLDGDGIDEIIAAYGTGRSNKARITVFRADGTRLPGGDFIALDSSFSFGARVAAGDFDGDGKAEIVVGAGPGSMNTAVVRIFSYAGGIIKDTGAYSVPFATRYGVNVAAGDIDGDGVDELIVAPGPDPKAMPVVEVLKIDTTVAGSWEVLQNSVLTITPFAGTYGANVTAGDLDGDGIDEVIAASGMNASVTGSKFAAYRGDGTPFGSLIVDGAAGGIEVAAGDINEDGQAEIITAYGLSRLRNVALKIYGDGALLTSFGAAANTANGAKVAVGKLGY